jgi:hypothetical protein
MAKTALQIQGEKEILAGAKGSKVAEKQVAGGVTVKSDAGWINSSKTPAVTTPTVSSSAQELADYAKANSVQNLQTLDWWSDNPNKQAAWDIIQGKTTPTNWQDVKTPDELNDFLNNMQSEKFTADMEKENTPPTRDATTLTATDKVEDNMSYFSEMLNPKTEAPTFSAENKLTELKTKYGTEDMESEITDIDAQIAELDATMGVTSTAERGKAVAQSVINGRISKEQQVYQEQRDYLNRQKTYKVNQLTNKYSSIQTIMDAAKTDYNTASAQYESDYNKNLQTITLMRGIQSEAKADEKQAEDSARANWQIFATGVTNGTMDLSKFTDSQKLLVSKLEVQSGLPAGTLENLAKKSGGMEMKSVLSGVDANGNSTATLILFNKQTGEYETETLKTDYTPGSTKSNIVQQGVRVNDDGNDEAWQIDTLGNVTRRVIGKSTKTADSPEAKEQNELSDFMLDIAKQRTKVDAMSNPLLTRVGAVQQIKAKYPGASDDEIKYILGES